MMDSARVCGAHIYDTSQVAAEFGISLASDERFAVVLLMASGKEVSMVLDLEWIQLARQIEARNTVMLDGITVPEGAIRHLAVGWPKAGADSTDN